MVAIIGHLLSQSVGAGYHKLCEISTSCGYANLRQLPLVTILPYGSPVVSVASLRKDQEELRLTKVTRRKKNDKNCGTLEVWCRINIRVTESVGLIHPPAGLQVR